MHWLDGVNTTAAHHADLSTVYPAGDHAFHADDCTCEGCDPAGAPRSFYGDHDGDFDADDVRDAIRCGDLEPYDAGARW